GAVDEERAVRRPVVLLIRADLRVHPDLFETRCLEYHLRLLFLYCVDCSLHRRGPATSTPHGPRPTGTRETRAPLRASSTATSGPAATYSLRPSGVIATPHARAPTASTVRSSVCVSRSMKAMLPCLPLLTYARVPSGAIAMPIGRAPRPVCTC